MVERIRQSIDGYRKSWSEISSKISIEKHPEYKGFIRDYFRAQLRLAQGKRVKAGRIFKGLDKRVGYLEFEENNESLLAAIDIAVRGETNRKNIRPNFEIVHS